MGKILYEIITGNEVSDFPECPSWCFDSSEEADLFKALNKIILKAADPIAQNRHQSGQELLADLGSVFPTETELAQATHIGRDWGRHVYAMFTLALVLMVSLYVRMIDDALAKAIDRSGEAQIYHRSTLMDQNQTIEEPELPKASVAKNDAP